MTKDDLVIICGDFGGAKSHDIQDEILNLGEEEKIYNFRKRGADFRIYVLEDFYNKTNTGKINGRDILICKDGALSGKICKVPDNINDKMLANEHVYIIRTNQEVSQDYLFYILASQKGQEILKANVNGAGIGVFDKIKVVQKIREF